MTRHNSHIYLALVVVTTLGLFCGVSVFASTNNYSQYNYNSAAYLTSSSTQSAHQTLGTGLSGDLRSIMYRVKGDYVNSQSQAVIHCYTSSDYSTLCSPAQTATFAAIVSGTSEKIVSSNWTGATYTFDPTKYYELSIGFAIYRIYFNF